MKQTTDLMHYGLNEQPDTTATTYNCQLSPLCRICNPTPMNSGFAIHTATNLLRRALLLLTLLAGWGMSAVAQETNLWTGPGTETNIASTAFGSFEVSTDVFRVYTDNNPIHIRTTWWNSVLLSNETTFQPNGSYYITDLNCYEIPLSAFVNDFVNKINTEGGLVVGTENGGTINGITLFTPQKDNFINEAVSNCATTSGSEEIARDLATKTINLSGASLTGVNYARIYLANANGNAVDPTGLLTVTYNSSAATAAGTNVKNGVYVYDSGNVLDLSNVSVTLNAGAGNFTNYQIVCLLSNDMSTATFTGGDLTQEPKWQEEYTYTFTYPIYVQTFTLDESVLTGNDIVIDNNSQYCNQILSFFGKTAAQMASSWYGRWYVTNASGTIQTLNLGTSASSNWTIAPRFENNAYNIYQWNVSSNIANTSFNQDWYVNQALCRARVFAPSSGTFDNYQGYRIVFEATDEYTSGTPAMKLRYIFVIPSTAHFEYDGTITNGTTPVIQTLPSRLASEVTLDWTSTTATSAMTTTGVKYARFYVVDDNDTPVDATDNAHKLTITGATATPCVNPASGYYVYPGSNADIDFSSLSVKLSSTGNLSDYKVVCWLATSTTNIAFDGTSVTEEPDITNEYVYSFTKPAPTTVDKTGTIAWGASMQADASEGAPADWGTTWAELSREQRVVWFITDGTTKQALALGTAAQSGSWVLGLPTDKFSISSNEAVLTGQTSFTATEWATWGKPDVYAPTGMAFADGHSYQVVCEVYETATGTTPNVRYTISFTKDFLGELKSGVTATTHIVTLANATDVSGTLSDVTIPAGTKYVRFYLTDASGNAVDPTGKLSVSGSSTVSGHAEYGYYLYDENGISAPTVTLTLSDATLNQYKVVMVTSADNAVTESGVVVNEPDYDSQTTWSFKYPVQHTEATGEVEWSPSSMTVTFDIDALKGSGYKSSLGGNYHVVWTVEDAGGTTQALTTGTSRQSGTWTYSVDGDNATFYAPTGQTFADVQNLTFVARLYETATGENDADKSLTYTVSIVKTGFFGELKDPTQTGSTTVSLNEESTIPASVPLSNATTAFSGAKYARVWLTQGSTLVDPTGKLATPTDMTAFGTNHDVTYGYYLYDANGITLSDATLTLAALADYPQYQVHIALSTDAPISYSDFARGSGPRRAPADAHEPDYDYEYTINFSYQDNSMRVIKVYAQASEGENQGNSYNTANANNDKQQSFLNLITAAFAELGETLDYSNCFAKWVVLDENGQNIALKQYYAAPGQILLGNVTQACYHANADENQGGIPTAVYVFNEANANNALSGMLDANLSFGHGVFQRGKTIELWVTNENSHTVADPTGGYKVKLQLLFNEDGNPPYSFLNETDITATKKMVDVSTLSASSPVFDMTDALVSDAKYARIYLAKYGDANNASSDLLVTYNGEAATACADPYGRYGWYISDDNGIDLENLIVGSTTLTADEMLKYNLVVVSSTSPLTGGQEPAWEQKTVYSFQKEVMARIYAEEGTETTIAGTLLNNPSGSYTLAQDILRRIDATVSDFSNTLYVKWYVEDKNGVRQAVNGGNGSSSSSWNFEVQWEGIRDWVVGDHQLQYYTNQNANSSPSNIEQQGLTGQITTLDEIHIQVPGYLHNYLGYRIVYEFSDEYDTADGADPGFRLRYVYTITDPNDFEGVKNTGGAEVNVTQTVNRTAESINLTLDDNNPYVNSGWAFEHEKLATRWEMQQTTTWPYWQWVQVQTPLRYARFYLIDAEGNQEDPTGKLTVTYGGNNATVTACTTPEHGYYIFGEGGTTINRNQVTVSLAAPKEYKLYKVVCVFSTALDGIVPADLTTPLQREPDYDLKYTYSFDYPTPTTKEINITIPWSKTGMRLRANTDEDGNLLTTSSVEDAWGISFPELSAGQYVRWYVQRRQGNNDTRQQLVSGSERTNGAWALSTASVYNFLDRPNPQGGDQAYLTGRTDFTEANWNNVWSSPTIYAPTNFNPGPAELNECRFICEVYADDDDSGTPYVRYIFSMEKFLGDLKDAPDGVAGEETILLDRNTTTYAVPLDDIYEQLNIPANEKIVYARVWLTKSDGTPVLPNGFSWTQMYDGHNQAQVLPGDREVYGWYFCSANIGQHTTGMDHGELASPPNSCTLSLPAGTYSQYQVHVALSTDNPSGMRWNDTTSRWEYGQRQPGDPDANVLGGQPAEPDFDYEFTIKFDYGFEAQNIHTVKTKYKTAIYDETTHKFTPTLFQNWLEVAADCDVQRQELADKAYARWYLEDLDGNKIQIEELTSPQPYTSLGNPYGYYRYKFDVERFNDTRGLTDNGYNPTITLPNGYTFDQVRLVCVVTTKTEPQTDNPDVPYDIPAMEPQELQVKYIYSLVKASDFTNLPFVHYQGEAYKWLTQMGRNEEANADRDYIIVEGEAGAVEKSWDFENSEVSEQTFGNIRQNVHTVDYYVYFDPNDNDFLGGVGKALMLPSQHYFGGGNDTEPRAYYRWYDYTTDVKADCLTAYGSELHLYPNDPDATEEKAGDPSRGLFAMLLRNTDDNPCDGNIGVRFHAPAGWNADSEEILVACDVSRYLDGMDDTFTFLLHEPTLSVRYLFHILPAQKIATDIAAAATVEIDGTTYTGLDAVEKNLQAQYEAEDTELYEYNGRTVVSLKGTTGSFTMRSDLQKLDSYWIYDSNNNLVNCNTLQWYAYYRDVDDKVWKLKVDMNGRETSRLALYELSDFAGTYSEVGGSGTKTISADDLLDDRLYMVGCMGNGYDEAPVVWNELNFIDAKPLLIGNEGTVPERTDQYMRSEYTLAQVLDFNDFFDEDERFNKPTSSFENYAKVPIIWPDAQYGFCYPQLYGLCGTNKYGNWGVYGVSPTHGDYTLLKSMNLPGVSADENFTEQSIGSQWWWNEPLYDVTHTRAASGNVATDANDYGTFLYVDASDEARVIAELEFDAALCADAEIYYTAYVADMTNNITRPQVRFRVSTDVDGERVPVVTFETGNIVTEGATTGFWHQVYGYTVLPDRLKDILNGSTRHYYVSVENSCENTDGADYTVDQISFYTHQASVKAKIVSDICDDGPVTVKIIAEAEQLLKSLRALSPSDAPTKDVFFCIAERYDDLNHELHAEDIVTGNGIYTDQNNNPNNEYGVVSVPLDLDLLTNATELHDGTKENSGFYYDATDDVVYFQLDLRQFDLEAGKKYFVSIYDMSANRVGGLDGWGTPYSGNACSVYSNDLSPNRMYVDLTVDGQTTDGHIEFGCNVTEVTKRFDIAINYPSGDGYDRYTYFKYDYFELAEGKTIIDFKNIKDENDIYLETALATFREWMRYDQAGLPEEEKDFAVPGRVYSELPRPDENDTEHMAMYNLIMKYMEGFEGAEGKLYLSAMSGIERTFTEAGVYKYLAIPLTKEVPTGGEVCSPIEFDFNVDASYGGPEILLGFDDVAYPDGYTRVVRAGLEQLNKMKSESYMLHIPISSYHNKGQGMGSRIYFQNTNLYLAKTNDPTIETDANGVPTESTTIKVAEIKVPEDATGMAYVGPDRMYLPIDFSQGEVTFHEGYWYEVNTSFIDETDVSETNPCVGDLFFILKVVPEFATWEGQPIEENTAFLNANWYNDQNWKRSVRADLYKDAVNTRNQNTSTLGHPNGYEDDTEIDAALTGDPGFVPMKFTYVTFLPGKNAPSLIKEPKVSTSSSQQGGGLLDPNQTRMLTDPSPFTNQVSSQPTENIRYDMLVRYGAHSEGGEGCFGHRLMTLNQAGKYVWGNDPRSEEQMETFNTNRKAFDVEKFYGNICREVYFKPGAELLRQQRLSYNRAWVEKEMVANKWYLVASPLKETYAGDMYVPFSMTDVATDETVKGRQATEAFQPISFNTAAVNADADHTITSQPAYSRTKYPVYQRSWNTDGARVYTRTNDARATDYSANLGYTEVTSVATEWSHTYNDVQVPYTTLTGFSVRPHKKDQTDNALIRLPKADTQYDYYQWDNTSPANGKVTHEVTRTVTAPTSYPLPSRYTGGITDNYRMVVDDPVADGLLTVNISDLQQQDGYILVGNPHMASLRMDKFFEANPGLAPSYWTYEGSVASAALAKPETITATGDDNADGIIRPMQAFFVKKKTELAEGETEATTITFNRNMTIDGNYPAIPASSDPARLFTLYAASAQGGSSAVMQLSDDADAGYHEGEDVETLFDSQLSDVPMVYTVAGNQAVSIDQRPALDLVSFGVVQAQDEPVQVTLNCQDPTADTQQLYVIDALTGEQTLVTDGTTLTVQPNDYGRYFLSATAVQSNTDTEQSIIISVRHQDVTVTANGGQLKRVRVTTLNGITAYSDDTSLSTQCRFQLPKGVYVILASTEDGTQRQLKVVVK